jgi:hypothetical protein
MIYVLIKLIDYNLNLYMTTINDFTILEKLGEGTFSSVYKGKISNLV